MKTNIFTCILAALGAAGIIGGLLTISPVTGLIMMCLGVGNLICAYVAHRWLQYRPPVTIQEWDDMVKRFKALNNEQIRQQQELQHLYDTQRMHSQAIKKISKQMYDSPLPAPGSN